MKLKNRSQNWRRRLPRPIAVRNGATLRLLGDCRTYVFKLDEGEQGLRHWQRAIELMLDAAGGGDLEAVVAQFERILIHQNKLVLEP